MSGLPEHLQTLLLARAYPHPVRAVELVETHLSWVLLTGEFAYKIKRPVRYPFVDLRSAARRTELCHEEVRLNHRFAPELYLGVSPISSRGGEARLEGAGQVIEHAVKMREFAREQQLERLLEAGGVEPTELEAFGRELAGMHARLPAGPNAQGFGRPERLAAQITANAAECARAMQALGDGTALAALQTPLQVRLGSAMELLAQRLSRGRVRECHGDLHAGNVVRRGARLLPFDCLEFDAALRWTDVADEIAFLLADLEVRQRAVHAQAFLSGYLEENGDYQACALLPLFKAHRALVRAKIAALDAMQARTAGTDNSALRRQSRAYVQGARGFLEPPIPLLVLMCGLSGSGKTWIARRLAPRLPAVHLRSDLERKRIAGLAATERSASGIEQGLHSRLAECAEYLLTGGYAAIIDATLARREDRVRFRELAARLGAGVRLVYCHAPRKVLEARIAARRARADDASEADLAVLAWQESRFERPGADEAIAILEPADDSEAAVQDLARRIHTH
jgi:uncharacterized protein